MRRFLNFLLFFGSLVTSAGLLASEVRLDAVCYTRTDTLQKMIESDSEAWLSARDSHGSGILHIAGICGTAKTFRMIHAKAPEQLYLINDWNDSPLRYAVRQPGYQFMKLISEILKENPDGVKFLERPVYFENRYNLSNSRFEPALQGFAFGAGAGLTAATIAFVTNYCLKTIVPVLAKNFVAADAAAAHIGRKMVENHGTYQAFFTGAALLSGGIFAYKFQKEKFTINDYLQKKWSDYQQSYLEATPGTTTRH